VIKRIEYYYLYIREDYALRNSYFLYQKLWKLIYFFLTHLKLALPSFRGIKTLELSITQLGKLAKNTYDNYGYE